MHDFFKERFTNLPAPVSEYASDLPNECNDKALRVAVTQSGNESSTQDWRLNPGHAYCTQSKV